jgi:hypothetical protein
MTIEEYRSQYAGVSSAQVRGLIADTANAFRAATEALYEKYFKAKLNKNCPDCWYDAFLALMRGDLAQMKKRAERSFELRAGALLVAPNGDATKLCNMNTLTDELALYHLSTHPACIELFDRYPRNWETLVAEYVNEKAMAQLAIENAEREKKAQESAPQAAGTQNVGEGIKVPTPKKKSAQSAKKPRQTKKK